MGNTLTNKSSLDSFTKLKKISIINKKLLTQYSKFAKIDYDIKNNLNSNCNNSSHCNTSIQDMYFRYYNYTLDNYASRYNRMLKIPLKDLNCSLGNIFSQLEIIYQLKSIISNENDITNTNDNNITNTNDTSMSVIQCIMQSTMPSIIPSIIPPNSSSDELSCDYINYKKMFLITELMLCNDFDFDELEQMLNDLAVDDF